MKDANILCITKCIIFHTTLLWYHLLHTFDTRDSGIKFPLDLCTTRGKVEGRGVGVYSNRSKTYRLITNDVSDYISLLVRIAHIIHNHTYIVSFTFQLLQPQRSPAVSTKNISIQPVANMLRRKSHHPWHKLTASYPSNHVPANPDWN